MLLWQEVLVLRKKVVHLVKKNESLEEKNGQIPRTHQFLPLKILIKRKSNRKQGAQKAHQGRFRKYVPSSEGDKIEDCLPPSRCSCEGLIQVKFHSYARHQQYKLPVITSEITEYRIFSGVCGRCCIKIFWNRFPHFSCFLPNSYGI